MKISTVLAELCLVSVLTCSGATAHLGEYGRSADLIVLVKASKNVSSWSKQEVKQGSVDARGISDDRKAGKLPFDSDFLSFAEIDNLKSHQAIFNTPQASEITLVADGILNTSQIQSLKVGVDTIIKELPSGWDILILNWEDELCDRSKEISNKVVTAVDPQNVVSFVVSKSGLSKLNTALLVAIEPVQFVIQKAIRSGILSAYRTKQPILDTLKHSCGIDDGISTITTLSEIRDSFLNEKRKEEVCASVANVQSQKELKLLAPSTLTQFSSEINVENQFRSSTEDDEHFFKRISPLVGHLITKMIDTSCEDFDSLEDVRDRRQINKEPEDYYTLEEFKELKPTFSPTVSTTTPQPADKIKIVLEVIFLFKKKTSDIDELTNLEIKEALALLYKKELKATFGKPKKVRVRNFKKHVGFRVIVNFPKSKAQDFDLKALDKTVKQQKKNAFKLVVDNKQYNLKSHNIYYK